MLFFRRKFFPFFITQFFGAFNDNLFRNAILIYFSLILAGSALSLYTNLAMALFILPMFIFSAWSGLLAERIEKRRLILWLKVLELVIIVAGIAAFFFGSKILMLIVLCLLGLQSAFFGPVKYGILPECLQDKELMAGNALVEAGTYIAILAGTILGSEFAAHGFAAKPDGSYALSGSFTPLYLTMLTAAGIGAAAAVFIPRLKSHSGRLPPFHPWRQTLTLLRETKAHTELFRAILAISWFWLAGAVLLTQIPQLTSKVFGAAPAAITYLLALFSIGIALGSLAAAKISGGRIDPSLSAFAALMMNIFLLLIVLAAGRYSTVQGLSLGQFLREGPAVITSLGFFGTAFFGGMFAVPFYALLQYSSEDGRKSQTIAANNIVNAFYIVIGSLAAILLLSVCGLSLQMLFCLLLIVHFIFSLRLFRRMPGFCLRILANILARFAYRLRIRGVEHLPAQGAALIICNHITYMDALILMAASPRPLRFVIYYKIYNFWLLKWLFKSARTIPIAGSRENPKIFRASFEQIHEDLAQGELVLIFPEGSLTYDGAIAPFQRGVEYILERDPVPVIPARLDNLWGSFFSRDRGLFKGGLRKFRAVVTLTFAPAISPELKAPALRDAVLQIEPANLENKENPS